MDIAFILSFTELTTAIPNAEDPFVYAQRAFGELRGYIAAAG
jgi:amino acid transporter